MLEKIKLHDDFVDNRVGAVCSLFIGCVNSSDDHLVPSY